MVETSLLNLIGLDIVSNRSAADYKSAIDVEHIGYWRDLWVVFDWTFEYFMAHYRVGFVKDHTGLCIVAMVLLFDGKWVVLELCSND
jgi:hypothetical protein